MNSPRRFLAIPALVLALTGCQGFQSSLASRPSSVSSMPRIEEPPALGLGLSPSLGGTPMTEGASRGYASTAPIPEVTARPPEGRGLLRTGAIQLGPGVGQNLWGWQGDGLGGF